MYRKSLIKPRDLINFMVHNLQGLNRERGQIETVNLLNLLNWMGKLTRVEFKTRAVFEDIRLLFYMYLELKCME